MGQFVGVQLLCDVMRWLSVEALANRGCDDSQPKSTASGISKRVPGHFRLAWLEVPGACILDFSPAQKFC